MDNARTATVKANEDTDVLCFNKDEFFILYDRSIKNKELKMKALDRIKNNFYGIKN
jgi:hypothetical protein